MKCTKCGSNISSNQAFCSVCGAPVEKEDLNYEGNNRSGRKNGVPIWLVATLMLVIIAIMLVIMFVVLNNKDNSQSNNKEEVVNNVVESNEINNTTSSNTLTNNASGNKISGNNVSQGNQATSYYKVKLNGYQIKVPDNLIYSVKDEDLMLMDEAETWLAEVSIQEGSFSALSESDVASYLRSAGFTVNTTKETKIGGLTAIVSEITVSGTNTLVAYVRINSMYMGCIVLYSSDFATYNYNALDIVAKTLATVQVDEKEPDTSVNLSTDDFSKFSDYLNK